jgi:hypothetical protein
MRFLRVLFRPRLLMVYAFALVSFLAMLGLEAFAPRADLAPTPLPTAMPLIETRIEALGLSLLRPATWPPPVVTDDHTLILSATGSTDVGATAGPFVVVTIDALTAFRSRLAFRDDYPDPGPQLDALTNSLNRNGARFEPAEAYPAAAYPAAITRGYERGNELNIVLMNAGERGWLYVGTQARRSEFGYAHLAVFKPVTDSIRFF